MPELFGGDVSNEVVVGLQGLFTAKVERLHGVVHQGRHLAETSAHKLLDGRGGVRVALFGWWQFELKFIDA